MQTITQELNTLAQMHYAIAQTGILASASLQTTPTGGPDTYIKRPWIDPPEGYSPFDPANGLALPVLGAASTTALTTATGDKSSPILHC